jgi:hypothetical protein
MSGTKTADHPVTDPKTFRASYIDIFGQPHKLTVTGEAIGDYRVQDVKLVRAAHHGSRLVLKVIAKLGPVENPHPEFERLWPLEYVEDPAKHKYTEVEIVNGPQQFTINVIFTV